MIKKITSAVVVVSIAALSLIPAAEARRISITKGYSGAPYTFNLKSSNTAAIRTAWASGNVQFPAIGDSTTAGQSAGVGTAQAVNSWPMQLAPILRGLGINSGANNAFADRGSWGLAQTITNLETGDGRISHTANAALTSSKAVGGNAFGWSSAGSVSFAFQEPVDTMVIYWRDGASGRNFTWQVGSGSTTQISSTGATQLAGYNAPLALGQVSAQPITIAWVLGSITPVGISAYNSSLGKELSILNWGISGATSTVLNDNTDTGTGRLLTINAVKPAGAFYEAGLINDWRTSITVATSKTNMALMVSTIKANGGNPILVVPVFDPGVAGNTANQTQYVQAMYQIAAEYDVPLIDIRQKWASNANAVALGYQPAGDVHPTTAGYADIAKVTAKVIQAIINNSFAANDNFPKEEKTKFAVWMKDLDLIEIDEAA